MFAPAPVAALSLSRAYATATFTALFAGGKQILSRRTSEDPAEGAPGRGHPPRGHTTLPPRPPISPLVWGVRPLPVRADTSRTASTPRIQVPRS